MGFTGLTCIKCGQADCVSLDLDDCTTFRCRECDDEFTTEDVKAQINLWRDVVQWLESPLHTVAGKVA